MKPLRMLDRWLAGYNLVLAGVWIPELGKAPSAFWIPVVHLLAASLPWIPCRGVRSASRIFRILRAAYPWVAFVLFWSELGHLQGIRQAPGHDPLVATLDLRIFGSHLHDLWPAAAPATWVQEVMFGSYLSYYLLVFGPVLFAGLTGRGPMYRDMTYRLLATYLGCNLLYALFPVYGPRFGAGTGPEVVPEGFFYSLAEAMRAAGDSPGTAFPSSHVAGVLTAAYLAFRWLPRPMAWGWALGALAVAIATVYTRNHMAVDVVAGAGAAVVLQTAASRLVPTPRPEPLRPAFPGLSPERILRAGGGS